MDVSLTRPTTLANPELSSQDSGPDFMSAEVVETVNGVVVRGAFGEISERQVLSNGVTIQGRFYE
ncbi:MAG: hypothetical protein OM95_16125 [Bdellovibrio sp. ArHS]|nr:MAG: hypothetical protein OM95_16125 [Bdellovibrio sp. ArHS]